ncbi:MAG: glucose-6-phosphate isomerase [Bacilli bacterium]|nr:glucose-6-phosphate isomerase [Bacilli bacterium]MDD4547420.1 glucose-6-phosphate isomerase [Bacilli bacterium]
MIKFDFSTYMKPFNNILDYQPKINKIINLLETGTSMNDWYDLGKCITPETLEDVLKTSDYIRSNCDVFLVIGVGGSSLGAKAVIDAFKPYFKKSNPEIIFLGSSLSSTYLEELIKYIDDKEVIINVISKSGTTFETNLYFEYLYNKLSKRYSAEELSKRIIVTTDAKEGSLRQLVNEKNYKSFVLPSNIGGRYSVMTVVGLLPIAVAGVDINEMIIGAKALNKQMAFDYAVIRDLLYKEDKKVESITIYEPKLLSLVESIKQVLAETQGKEGKGILPIASINTGDLHSLGQFYQDGSQILFETVINIECNNELVIPKYNKELDEINKIVANQVATSHMKNKVCSNFISLDALTPFNIGQLIYFFEIAAAAGAYLLEVEPFNQPGVNEYKKLVLKELDGNE